MPTYPILYPQLPIYAHTPSSVFEQISPGNPVNVLVPVSPMPRFITPGSTPHSVRYCTRPQGQAYNPEVPCP